MGYDTKLDDQGRPSADCWVPFDEIKQALLVDGVGPKRLKLAMSEKKLGMQLTALGYASPKEPKSIKVGGKWTTKRVRYGLQRVGLNCGSHPQALGGGQQLFSQECKLHAVHQWCSGLQASGMYD